MKDKDLTVGMEVAVKIRHSVCRAWVLQTRTTWIEQRFGKEPFRDSGFEANKVAVACDALWAKYLQPEVVLYSAILSPWSDYLAQKEKDNIAADIAWQAEKDRLAKQAADRPSTAPVYSS